MRTADCQESSFDSISCRGHDWAVDWGRIVRGKSDNAGSCVVRLCEPRSFFQTFRFFLIWRFLGLDSFALRLPTHLRRHKTNPRAIGETHVLPTSCWVIEREGKNTCRWRHPNGYFLAATTNRESKVDRWPLPLEAPVLAEVAADQRLSKAAK